MTIILVGIIAISGYLKFKPEVIATFSIAATEEAPTVPATDKVIVIDPGHGGYDPGKVGVSGVYEKDINLQLSLKLQKYLEDLGHTVVLTRDEDEDLDGIDGKFSKNGDMRARKEIVNGNNADVVISVHQNAFSDPKVRGAQVFYYNDASPGKVLAQFVQNSIKQEADPNNTRSIKNSESYYLLKCTNIPSIIVECGFLTNPDEENMLKGDEYQDKIAYAISQGINQFFELDDKVESQSAEREENTYRANEWWRRK